MHHSHQQVFDFAAPPSWSAALTATAPCAPQSPTSRAAADAIAPSIGRLQVAVLEFIRARGTHGATDEEITLGLGLLSDTARARRVELRDRGAIRDSGHRRPTRRGRAAGVWVAAETFPGKCHEPKRPGRPR